MAFPDLLPVLTGVVGAAAGIGGAVLAPIISASQGHRGWLRDKRASIYEQYAQVLVLVDNVVNYDDDINLRLGNEMTDEWHGSVVALDKASASFGIYASEELRSRADKIRDLYRRWSYADMVIDDSVEVDEFGGTSMRQASPLDDDFPWEKINSIAGDLRRLMSEQLETIRFELKVATPG